MIYGLYLSASGVISNAYRQDVISNNLANTETVGFKRDLAMFRERRTEADTRRADGRGGAWGASGPGATHPLLENIGGGLLAHPTVIDAAQGELEPTGGPLDAGIEGDGYFAVKDGGETRLTRNGQFSVDRKGHLVLANGQGQKVLDPKGDAITLNLADGPATIGGDGLITQSGKPVARVGLFDVADRAGLRKDGGTLLSFDGQELKPAAGAVHGEYLERANVDPATELASLMDTQRQLEANANMIRYQDQTLAKLVNEVGKIG
jgi:flagellar basal body rod protein FlgG